MRVGFFSMIQQDACNDIHGPAAETKLCVAVNKKRCFIKEMKRKIAEQATYAISMFLQDGFLYQGARGFLHPCTDGSDSMPIRSLEIRPSFFFGGEFRYPEP